MGLLNVLRRRWRDDAGEAAFAASLVREVVTESDDPVPAETAEAAMQLARRGLSLETLRAPMR